MPLDITTLDWVAEIAPMYDAQGNEVDPDIGRLVVRSDTREPIGTCGRNTSLIQHQDVVAPVIEALREAGITEFHLRPPRRRDLYDLKGKAGAFIETQMTKNGGIMKTVVTTGNFIAPTGPSSFLPNGPPTCFQEFLILNSHTGTYAAQIDMRYKNVVCMNGLVRENFSANVKAKHTTGFNIEAFKAKIHLGASLMETDAERFEKYVRTPLSYEQAGLFFKKTIARLSIDPATGDFRHSAKLVEDLLTRFSKEPRSVWGAYMAMTEWATHGDLREGSDSVTARTDRDSRVARALRSGMFQALLETS